MPELEYRGYRIRTLFDTAWEARLWPPIKARQVLARLRAAQGEGEDSCRRQAFAAVDAHLDRVARRASKAGRQGQPG